MLLDISLCVLGPAFNSLLKRAYDDGATWLYRVNDDSIPISPFARRMTDTLKSFGPPFGAVGPFCVCFLLVCAWREGGGRGS
jgi:hypothetical protein